MASQIQTRSSARAAEPPVTDFDSIIGLPYSVLTDEIKTGDYRQIQDFCRFLGLPVKGARAELERRIFEFKTKLDAGDAILPSALPSDSRVSLAGGGVGDVSTPERRDGRRRSPHRGNTVVTWPAVASLPSYDRMDESAPLPDAASTVQDPLLQSDPWKTYMLSTPMTRRSDAAHSGLTRVKISEIG